jgi:hypothetical protein
MLWILEAKGYSRARLHAVSKRNPLARALQQYGRLIKTNFVLASIGDEELRRRVGRPPDGHWSLRCRRRHPKCRQRR